MDPAKLIIELREEQPTDLIHLSAFRIRTVSLLSGPRDAGFGISSVAAEFAKGEREREVQVEIELRISGHTVRFY